MRSDIRVASVAAERIDAGAERRPLSPLGRWAMRELATRHALELAELAGALAADAGIAGTALAAEWALDRVALEWVRVQDDKAPAGALRPLSSEVSE